jgi:hypothetical protein
MAEFLINIQNATVQSASIYPTVITWFPSYDLTDRYLYSDETRIHIVAPDVDQTVIQFTDGNHGAMMSTLAEFLEDRTNQTEINIDNSENHAYIQAPISVSIPVVGPAPEVTEPVYEEPAAPETHEIRGSITQNSKVVVLDATTKELITTETVTAGSYSVSVPDTTVDVLAISLVDGKSKSLTGVVPLQK